MKSQSRTNGGTPRKVLRRWLQQLLGGDDVPTTETRLLLEPLEARQMMAGDVDLTPVNLPTSSLLSDSAEISSTSAQGEPQGEPAQDLVAFAKALKDAGVRFFGAIWCPFCNEQKALFGDGAPYLPFVEVTNPDRSLNSVGQQENIQTFPTWEFQNGTRVTGVKTLQELSTATGIAIPSSNNPSFRPIGNQTVLIGSPLYIPIDAYNPDNTPVTISVTSSNPSLLAATVLNNNRSLRFKIQDRGDMVFEMFESLAPTATARLIQLAQSGFYNKTASNTITFHRVIDNFVIQAGDPTGTGSGGSSLGTVRDDFNLDLQHNRSGLLSFAKSSDDTNDSQFFVTEGAQRHLDFNHSIMGVLVEGESVREGISQVPVNNTTVNKPTSDVIITSAEVFNDTENGVIQLKAVGNQTGTATITVTVTNQDGKTATEVFTVTIANDTTNTQPFLQPVVAPTTVPNGQSFNIQLASRDVEGDAVTYFARKLGNVNYTTSVNQSTGVVTVTPPAGFSGQLSVLVGVNQPSGLTFTTGSPEDTETVTVTVAAGAPTAVDLLAATDTGSSNTDNITSATSMQFTVSGVTAGSTVKLKAGATSLGEAVVASGQTSVTITTTKVADLGNGTHSITATQTIGGVESAASPALSVTFDTSAPGQITGDVLLSAIVGQPYVSDLAHPDEATGLNYSLQTSPAGMTIDATTGVISWTPTAGQVGTQPVIVKYTDLAGNTATQTFNVVVAASTSAIVRTEITDLSGNPLTTIASGQDFLVKIFVTDTRGVTAQGLFSAYLDVLYNAGLAEPSTTSPITYGSGFGNVQRPTLTDVNNARTNKTGKIGSFGGTNSSTAPVGADEQFLGTLRMKALKAGTLTVTTNPSEADGSEFLAYGTDTPVDEAKIQFGSDTLTITGSFTATNDTFNLDEDSTNFAMNVLANDQPASGSTLTIKSIGTAPTKGTATISADKKSIAFTPNANYNGGDQFTYVVQDQNGAEQTATVTVQVQPVNDAPTAVNDGLTVAQNASSTVIDVLANDLITPDSVKLFALPQSVQPPQAVP